MKPVRALVALLLALLVVAPAPVAAQTAPAALGVGPFAKGTVVALRGTPHLWFVDGLGTLHWASDIRALANRDITPGSRVEVTREQLMTLPRGEPWLSTAFVSIGEAIYAGSWAPNAAAPALLRVQSPADLQLLGVESSNYRTVVLERAAWEQRFGMSLDRLTRGELARLIPAGAAPEPWSQFASTAGGFAVWAPTVGAPPPAEQARRLPPELGDLHLFVFGSYLDGPSALYSAGSATLPREVLQQVRLLGPDAFFESIRSEIVRSEDVRLVGYRSITQGVHRGREVTLEPIVPERVVAANPFASLTVTFRVYIVGDKLYAVSALKSPATAPGPDVAKFLDSFRLLPSCCPT